MGDRTGGLTVSAKDWLQTIALATFFGLLSGSFYWFTVNGGC